jgi:hypothetical protein
MPARPPALVHLRAAAAAAKRSISSMGILSANASAKAPWKTSPAPVVSATSTGNAGKCRNLPPLKQ